MRAKSARKSANTGAFRPGSDPRRGKGPRKGAPNAGRPPSVIRDALRASFADRIHVLEAIADGECVQKLRLVGGEETETMVSASPADRLKALDLMAKYGGLQKIEHTGADDGPIQTMPVSDEDRAGRVRQILAQAERRGRKSGKP